MLYFTVRAVAIPFRKKIHDYPHVTCKKLPHLSRQISHFKHMHPDVINIFPCGFRNLPPFEKLSAVTIVFPFSFSPIKYEFNYRKQVWHLVLILLPVKTAYVADFSKQNLPVHPALIGNQIHQVDTAIQHLIFTQILILAP